MKSTSQDFKEPDKPQKKRKVRLRGDGRPSIQDHSSSGPGLWPVLGGGSIWICTVYGSGEDAYGYAYGMDD
jgi:hypothetical protein